MANEECYIKNPKTGLFEGSKPGCTNKTAKAGGDPKQDVVAKNGKRPTVNHGAEFAIPGNFHGDLAKREIEMFKSSREKLAEGGRIFPDKDVATYEGDGYWTGQASKYEAGKDELTAKQEPYGKDHSAVAINRIFSYKTSPTVRNEFVVVGDMGKDDGKIEIRRVNNTGMYASYIDENGVRQQYPHPTNIIDFHPDSLDKFCGKSNCGREPIMMKTCETMAECRKVQAEMKDKIKKWRDENVKKK
ncbi:MAG: hypothetical protein HQK98_05900 [Nitrospirae bacterium]|nr:hypothetical protein [Nitrospirota bacterium]